MMEDFKQLRPAEFKRKYNIPNSTYYEWRKKYLDIPKTETEVETGKIENIPSEETNKAILNLDETSTDVQTDNDKELIASICKVLYPLLFKIIEKFFRKKYKGDIDKFIQKVIPLWKRQLDRWGVNISSIDDFMLLIVHAEIIFDLEDISEKTERKEEQKIENKETIQNNQTSTDEYKVEDYLQAFPVSAQS